MKEYPEPESRWWDRAEAVLLWTIAAGLAFAAYMAWDFAVILAGGDR